MKWIELVGFPVNPPLNAWNHHQPPIDSHLNPIKPPWDYHFFALLDPHPKTSATTRCSQGCQVAGSTSWPPAVRCPPSPAFPRLRSVNTRPHGATRCRHHWKPRKKMGWSNENMDFTDLKFKVLRNTSDQMLVCNREVDLFTRTTRIYDGYICGWTGEHNPTNIAWGLGRAQHLYSMVGFHVLFFLLGTPTNNLYTFMGMNVYIYIIYNAR